MGRSRGRPSRGKGLSNPSNPKVKAAKNVELVVPGLVSYVSSTIMKRLEKSLSKTDGDNDVVKCSDCGEDFQFRQFRLHNFQYHLNTAMTTDEKSENPVIDHKYFARKLNEFKKLTKATVFECPRQECDASFKSTLGLAYHMNTCGRSIEEINAALIECEICQARLTLPQMQWHRKTHEERIVDDESDTDARSLARNKRQARARKPLEKDSDDSDSDGESNKVTKTLFGRNIKQPPAQFDKDSNDFCSYALKFLEGLDSDRKAWDDAVRNVEDLWVNLKDNKFKPPNVSDVESYLPIHKESVEFKYISDDGPSDYHRLTWFEGETVSGAEAPLSLHHAGGPVLSMSWHPSGKLLAVSVGRDYKEDIDLMKCQARQSCVQIYSSYAEKLSLQLVIGLNWGYATHIQWSTFCPDIMDSYIPVSESCFEDMEIFCRIGYLAMAFEDSTIRIMAVGIQDLKLSPNYEYKPGYKIKVYSKIPEICLKLDDSVMDDELGNVSKFDWHEGNQFLAAGYANGTIAVYDLQTKSKLLINKTVCEKSKVTVIYPFWTFSGHLLSIRGICFDPKNPRFLVTAGQDRCVKVWDIHTRMERDYKKGGIAVDMCWIRGWIHQAVSFECHVAFQGAMNNYVRVFPIGSSAGRPTSAEIHNFTSLDFFHGLTAQGTDDGKVNVTYYDWFWRECDYERNRKKKNLVILSATSVDESSYTPISKENFSVQLKKLSKSVWSSKAYQRLGINEEEGVYAVALEARFGGAGIFEDVPSIDGKMDLMDEGEPESEPSKGVLSEDTENQQTLPGDNKDAALLDSIDVIMDSKVKDGFLPVYDVDIPEETPRIIMSFQKQRPSSAVPNLTFDPQRLEEYVRFQPLIRINKVSWSPKGAYIAVGYRNGFITILPGSFDTIYS